MIRKVINLRLFLNISILAKYWFSLYFSLVLLNSERARGSHFHVCDDRVRADLRALSLSL